jgi:hypothetical protein
MIGMASWSHTDAALIGAAVGTVLLGVLVGRWWVLLAAIVPGALLAVATLVSDPDNFYEGSPSSWAAFVALCTIAITALLALGVGVNRSVRRLRALG